MSLNLESGIFLAHFAKKQNIMLNYKGDVLGLLGLQIHKIKDMK